MDTPHSPKLHHYWSLAIRLFIVICRILNGRGLTPLERCSRCNLLPQSAGPGNSEVCIWFLFLLLPFTSCLLFVCGNCKWIKDRKKEARIPINSTLFWWFMVILGWLIFSWSSRYSHIFQTRRWSILENLFRLCNLEFRCVISDCVL